jgi:predicted phosphatase
MEIVRKEPRPFDVDNTLIVHGPNPNIPRIPVYDPESKKFVDMGINLSMVKLLREEKYRGAFIIVWSRGGSEWAKNVVLALGLDNYVDLVITKPYVYFDDVPVEKWLESRIYLDENTVYKR